MTGAGPQGCGCGAGVGAGGGNSFGACGCGTADGSIANLPGQRALRWRVAPHGASLARMRTWLADESQPGPLRALADQGTDDPAIALLDAWAVVADVVSFYSERIAQEGYLRTAVEAASVRQEARTLGYELRPGVAAQAELAFTVETASGTPDPVVVPAGTPVQTVPTPSGLPQTFETSADLEARAAWNAIPAWASAPQGLDEGVSVVWLATTEAGARVGDRLLVVREVSWPTQGASTAAAPIRLWSFHRVTDVQMDPPNLAGWTYVVLDPQISYQEIGSKDSETRTTRVFRLSKRLNVFGWNAPDQSLFNPKPADWGEYPVLSGEEVASNGLELDGDHPDVVADSWVVLEQGVVGGLTVTPDIPPPPEAMAYYVRATAPDGATKFGLSGRLTPLSVTGAVGSDGPVQFRRNQVLVHAVATELPADTMPLPNPVGATDAGPAHTLDVVATKPPLPRGRLIAVVGTTAHGTEAVEATTIVSAAAMSDGGQRLTLDPPLAQSYLAGTVRVRANLARPLTGRACSRCSAAATDARRSRTSRCAARP